MAFSHVEGRATVPRNPENRRSENARIPQYRPCKREPIPWGHVCYSGVGSVQYKEYLGCC